MAAKKIIKKIVAKAKSTVKPLSIKKPFSKSEIAKSVAEMVGLGKNQATAAIESLVHIIKMHLSKKGPGIFVFPSMAKFHIVRKSATKARKGKNPFTGELMTFAAKPARNIVRIRPLKKLKDIAK
ncbi:DNA-binding protein [Gammaproteobacteria bacterium]